MQLPYWTWYRCKGSDPTETGYGLCNTTNKSGGNKGDGDFDGNSEDEPILRYDHSAWVAVVFIKRWHSSKSAVDGGEKWLVRGRRVLFVQPLGVPVLT